MSFLHKAIATTVAIGSANVAYVYLTRPQGTKITVIKNSSKETPDTRRFNKNPMDNKRKRDAYLICRLRQNENKDGANFCRNKWLK